MDGDNSFYQKIFFYQNSFRIVTLQIGVKNQSLKLKNARILSSWLKVV